MLSSKHRNKWPGTVKSCDRVTEEALESQPCGGLTSSGDRTVREYHQEWQDIRRAGGRRISPGDQAVREIMDYHQGSLSQQVAPNTRKNMIGNLRVGYLRLARAISQVWGKRREYEVLVSSMEQIPFHRGAWKAKIPLNFNPIQ